jgi:glycine/serine hydroxymethyltransferase
MEGKRPTIGSGVAGVISAWQNSNANFDDSYLFLKVKSHDTYINPLSKEKRKVEFIAGTTYADFENCTPNYKHYAEQVIKKAEPIYKAMNWDTSAIRTNKIQQSLEEWF